MSSKHLFASFKDDFQSQVGSKIIDFLSLLCLSSEFLGRVRSSRVNVRAGTLPKGATEDEPRLLVELIDFDVNTAEVCHRRRDFRSAGDKTIWVPG